MSELASEIRRIARGDKLKGPLSGTLERDPIGGTFVPFTNTPLSQITANGAEGEEPVDVNSKESDGTTDSDQPVNGDDPNTFTRGGAGAGNTGNTYDMEDVIDGTGDVPQSPHEQDNTANDEQPSDFTSGVIDHLQGATDCTTGDCINFHMDGNFPTPEGWDDPDSPPVDEYYQEGYFWKTVTYLGFVGYGRTPVEAVQNQCSDIRNGLSTIYPYTDENTAQVRCNNSPSSCLFFGGGNTSLMTVGRLTCGGASDPEGICALPPPTAEAWPEDGCYDLALIDGTFQTNQYDSEAPANAGGSKVNFCFGSGRTGTVEATANGGFMVYETNGGAPTGPAKVYGKDGTFQAAGDSTDQFMDQWRPK